MLKKVLNELHVHLPIVVGVVLVLVNTLVDQGTVHLSDQSVNVVNAVLAALGLGVLHRRQAK